MEEFWARLYKPSGQPGPNYWGYFAERLAHFASMPSGATILDIGTCDGNVLFKAMKKIKAQGYGIGIDIDYDDFHAGAAEAIQRGWKEKVAFVQMDANTLGFLPEIFHTVLANFVGWDDCFDFERMEFISSDKMVFEVMRVLRKSGQFGIGSWVEQCDLDWIAEEFNRYLPECGKAGGKSISCYSRENPEGHKVILQNGGFKNISVYVETTDFVSPDAETWWRQMKQAANDYFRQVPDPITLESFKEQVFLDLQQFQSPEGICFSKTVSFAFGTKPI
ncbi:MAG: class I SAM-dependent methyltransferase [Desulfobacteraceae bacterium]|nr:class I SAM-dependent methyltransferase [Desulfobacteraceae bacterium]